MSLSDSNISFLSKASNIFLFLRNAVWVFSNAKGVFPLNSGLNEEINLTLTKIKTKKKDMGKTVLGMPVKTLYIVGGIIVLAVIARQIMKKK